MLRVLCCAGRHVTQTVTRDGALLSSMLPFFSSQYVAVGNIGGLQRSRIAHLTCYRGTSNPTANASSLAGCSLVCTSNVADLAHFSSFGIEIDLLLPLYQVIVESLSSAQSVETLTQPQAEVSDLTRLE